MTTGRYPSTIPNRPTILLVALGLFICQFTFGSIVQAPLQTSIRENPSQEKSEIHSRSMPKSAIQISDPDQGTIWTVSQPAKIQWKTTNIDTSKSIRFFLAKDDMVVQELGSFENNSIAEGVELAKNVGSGNQYQVVGIELFPDNKFQVAKYATPYFSIRNPVAEARKKAALAKRDVSGNENRNSVANTRTKKTSSKRSTGENQGAAPVRDEFEGRKISYIKELSFAHEEITVSLWDHGRQDGDIVSIYLNGKTIISKHHLTYRRKKVGFKLDPNKSNALFLYAHNLGSSPPNTVSIELTDGSTSEKIVLNSDLKSCEAVQIKVSP